MVGRRKQRDLANSTRTDRQKRHRTLDALNAWGHDTGTLESVHDIAIRELRTRMEGHDSWWASNGIGGCAEDPPF